MSKPSVGDTSLRSIDSQASSINIEEVPSLDSDADATGIVTTPSELIADKSKTKLEQENRNSLFRRLNYDTEKQSRMRQNQALKELVKAREKEQRATQVERRRVLDDIVQDKLNRAEKFPEYQPQPSQSNSLSKTTKSKHFNPVARLQFKMPDGSTNIQEFMVAATLKDVRKYISQTFNLPFNRFSLSTSFPKRDFTSADDFCTLVQLGLVPNAVVLVIPIAGAVASRVNNSYFLTIFWILMGRLGNVLNYFKSFVVAPPQRPALDARHHATTPVSSKGESSFSAGNRLGRSATTPNSNERDSLSARDRNVHRLTDKRDSKTDNKTWNGNSTQQM